MAATFTTTGDWHGTLNIGFETADKPVGKEPAPVGWKWRRKIYRIDRRRFGQGMLTYTDTVGGTAAGNLLTVTNGSDEMAGSASQIYVLSKDKAVPSPQGSGIWEEVQSMTSYTDWALWEQPTP